MLSSKEQLSTILHIFQFENFLKKIYANKMETYYEWDFTKCNGQTPYLEIYADNNTCCPLPRSDNGSRGTPTYRPPPTPHSDSPLVSWGPINTPLQLVK